MRGSPFDAFVRPRDPHERYLIELSSLVIAVFKEAEGLDAQRDTLEIEEGGRQDRVTVPGPYAKGNFTLREGETDDIELFRWYEKSRDADHLVSSRRSGAVILAGGNGQERMRWKFRAAVIVGWEGPLDPPKAGHSFEIESLEIAHEGLETVLRM